ncbi:MAG TPA: glycosyltransferase family 39 protein [Candidatus Woesebacteria bacterium]|jgi:uncharacterized membrane protein|nr:glycosyltransferase family 39 protein [Candidatus Shapirobacteria bacterium]HOR01743.1 glycosyltransferase family 39 protein [Candidatus Woesebacteria bacterium]
MIWLILTVALGLRLIGLDQSLWLDEAISANVSAMPIKEIVTNFSVNDFHPPLYYWFLNIWQGLGGREVIFLRFSSIIFSLVTIYFVYLIGKKIKNKQTGIEAAILVAVNPLFVYFSQELRMYAMATMWLTIALFFLTKIKQKKYNFWDLFWYNLMSFLAFVTFYGSVFLLAAVGIYWLAKKEIKIFWATSWGVGLAVVMIWPLLKIQLDNSKVLLTTVTNWSLVLGRVNLKNLLLIPLKFSVGKVSWYPKYMYYLIGGGWTMVTSWFLLKGNKKVDWLKVLLILPIVLATLFSFRSPLLQYFRFIYLVPIVGIILSINTSKKWQKILIFGVYLIFSLIYLLNQNFYREDWKSVAKVIESKVYMIESFGDPIKFYNSKIEIVDTKTKIPTEEEIWVIPYGEVIHGVDHKKILTGLGYQKRDEKNFREVVVQQWEK